MRGFQETIFILSYLIRLLHGQSYIPDCSHMSAAKTQCAVEYRMYVAWMPHVVSKACSI
jgi:hypothetical protein